MLSFDSFNSVRIVCSDHNAIRLVQTRNHKSIWRPGPGSVWISLEPAFRPPSSLFMPQADLSHLERR